MLAPTVALVLVTNEPVKLGTLATVKKNKSISTCFFVCLPLEVTKLLLLLLKMELLCGTDATSILPAEEVNKVESSEFLVATVDEKRTHINTPLMVPYLTNNLTSC